MNTAKCLTAGPSVVNAGSRFERNRPRVLELFATRGYAQVSLRELARHLELTVGSVYSHCAGKEELLLEFIEEHYMALLALFERRRRRETPAATLDAVIQGLVALHTAHPLHFQLAIRDIDFLAAEQRQYLSRLREQLRNRLQAVLQAAGYTCPAPSGCPTLELFEHLPHWLAGYPLDERQKCTAILQSLTAPLLPLREAGR